MYSLLVFIFCFSSLLIDAFFSYDAFRPALGVCFQPLVVMKPTPSMPPLFANQH